MEPNKPTINPRPIEFVDPNPLLDFIKDIKEQSNPKVNGTGDDSYSAHVEAENGKRLSEPILTIQF